MARDEFAPFKPTLDSTQSVEAGKLTKTAVTQANGIKIKNAFEGKNNSLQIFIENTTNSSGTAVAKAITIKAGDNYPNKVLGDWSFTTTGGGAITVFLIEDISRFENRDGSIYIDFASGFTGNIWAVAKRAGLKPVA